MHRPFFMERNWCTDRKVWCCLYSKERESGALHTESHDVVFNQKIEKGAWQTERKGVVFNILHVSWISLYPNREVETMGRESEGRKTDPVIYVGDMPPHKLNEEASKGVFSTKKPPALPEWWWCRGSLFGKLTREIFSRYMSLLLGWGGGGQGLVLW